MEPRSNNRRGLTLLELLCASTLATLLMVALLGVVGGLAKTEKALDRREVSETWRRRLAARLASDLGAAETATPLKDGFELRGPLGRDEGSRKNDWSEATVAYRLEASPLGPVLLRHETRPGATPRIETLAFGAAQLRITAERGELTPQPTDAPFLNELLDGRTVPRTLRLVLTTPSGATLGDERITP